MLVKKEPGMKSSEIIDKRLFKNQKQFFVSTVARAGLGLKEPEFIFSFEGTPPRRIPQAKDQNLQWIADQAAHFYAGMDLERFY